MRSSQSDGQHFLVEAGVSELMVASKPRGHQGYILLSASWEKPRQDGFFGQLCSFAIGYEK